MIIFDVDGTLVDHEKAAKAASIELLRENSDVLNFEEKEFAKMWYDLAEQYFDYYTSGKMTYEEQRIARIKYIWGKMNRDISGEDAKKKYASFLGFYAGKWELYPDVVPCLDGLKNFKLGVISNGDFDAQVKKLKDTGVYERFSVMVTSELIGIAKPDRRIFDEACKKAGVKNGDCVYVGDKLMTDARAAKKAGLHGIWLDRKNESLGVEGVRVVRELTEVPGIVENL